MTSWDSSKLPEYMCLSQSQNSIWTQIIRIFSSNGWMQATSCPPIVQCTYCHFGRFAYDTSSIHILLFKFWQSICKPLFSNLSLFFNLLPEPLLHCPLQKLQNSLEPQLNLQGEIPQKEDWLPMLRFMYFQKTLFLPELIDWCSHSMSLDKTRFQTNCTKHFPEV